MFTRGRLLGGKGFGAGGARVSLAGLFCCRGVVCMIALLIFTMLHFSICAVPVVTLIFWGECIYRVKRELCVYGSVLGWYYQLGTVSQLLRDFWDYNVQDYKTKEF